MSHPKPDSLFETPHSFASLLDDITMPIVLTDARRDDNPIVFGNDAFAQLSGYPSEETVGRNCRFLQGAGTDRAAVDRIGKALGDGEPVALDLLNYRKDGTAFWNALHICPIQSKNGDIRFFFASQLDGTAHVEAQQEIDRQRAALDHAAGAERLEIQKLVESKVSMLAVIDQGVRSNMMTINTLVSLRASVYEDEPLFASILSDLRRRIGVFSGSLATS